MQILLTGAQSPLGAAVAGALTQAGHQVRRADIALTDPAAVAGSLAGVEAIVHLEPLVLAQRAAAGQLEASGELLDQAARGTHVLYKAAVEAGIGQAVQASTLAVMDAYGPQLEVTEQWRPRPQPVPQQLAPYVAELVAREFTRDVQLQRPARIVCLRFGSLDGETGQAGWPALGLNDAAQAVVKALGALERGERQRGHRWQLLHVDAPVEEARYASALARRTLGYGAARDGTAEAGR